MRLWKRFVLSLQRHNISFSLLTLGALIMAIHIPWIWIVVIFFIIVWWKELLIHLIVFVFSFYMIHQAIVHDIKEEVIGHARIVEVETLTYQMRYTFQIHQRRYHVISNESYELGQVWAIEAKVIPYLSATQPFGFHFKNYFFSQGIDGKLTIQEQILLKEGISFWQLRHDFKKLLLDHHQDVLVGYLFGENNLDETFEALNIDYLFKISGLHLYALIEWMQGDRKKKWLGSFLLIAVLYLQAFRLTLLRFVFMKLFANILKTFKLKLYPPLLTLIVWVVWMVLSPRMVLHFGFHMSMLIILFFQISQPFTSEKTPFQRTFLMSWMVMSLFFPFYGEWSLLRMIWLPIVIWLVIKTWWMIILLSSVMVIFQIDFFRYIETLFHLLIQVDDTIYFGVMPTFFIIVYLSVLFFFVQYSCKKAYLSFLMVLSVLFIHIVIHPLTLPTTITFLDVGQGDTTILSSKQCTMVIDAFDTSVSYLKNQGIDTIDYLFLTHADDDHVKEAQALIDTFNVKHVIVNPYDDYELKAKVEIAALRNYQCGAFNVEVMSPSHDYDNSNDNSLVLKLEVETTTMLLMGDAGIEVEHALMKTFQERLEVDLLKVGHHGSNTSTSYEWIAHIKPKLAIISVGRNNRYEMPHQEVLFALSQVKTYRTDLDGSIVFTFKKSHYTVKTYAP